MDYKCNNWYLYFSAITANLFFISTGCAVVWNSPVLPQLRSNDTSINPIGEPITLLHQSTITSLFPIGATIGTLLVGKIPDLIGRKKTLVCIATGVTISFVGLSFTSHVYVLFVFLPLLAINISAGSVVIPMYTAEIAEEHNRGNLGCLLALGVCFGQVYAYAIGAVSNVQLFCLLCGAPAFLVLILCSFIPESPTYLSSKGDKLGTILVLKQLRRKTFCDLDAEYTERQHILQNKASQEKKMSFKSLFTNRATRKGFLLSVVARMSQQLAGVYIVISSLGPLLNESGGNLSGNVLAIIVAGIKFFAVIITIFTIEKTGRRILILLSTSICGTSMLILGFYYYFKSNDYSMPEYFRLIPVFCLICFVVFFALGLSSVPYILVAELLPNELRSVGFSISQFTCNLCTVALSFTFPIVTEYLGLHYYMFAFSFFSYTSFIVLFLFLPETKGKSFEEIRNILNS